MFWNEDDSLDAQPVPDDILDLLFAIDCRHIPVDHAYALSAAIQVAVPWMAAEPRMAIHTIHVAGSQNGWERPAHGTDSLLMVSRRAKLTIRTPSARAQDLLDALPGVRLELDGHPLTLGAGKIKPLSQESTLLARHVAAGSDPTTEIDEQRFLDAAAGSLAELGIHVRKALCGKTLPLATPQGPIQTRSLMLAGLDKAESIRLQQEGLGPYRLMGCGIFIPHKGIDPVKKMD